MANHTPMVIVLKDGDQIRGTIEWYDRAALKVHRPDAPNILLMKDTIKYMYKADDDHYREGAEEGRVSGRPRLALTVGDPAGIGPEIVLRALASEACPSAEWVVYGPLGSLAERARRFGLPDLASLAAGAVDIPGLLVPLGAVSAEGGRVAAAAVLAAVGGCPLRGASRGIVTAPLHKESLRAAGHPWPGHTEMLAEAAGVSDVAMLFVGGGLRVALLTIHRSLRSVPDAITRAETVRIVRLVHRELPRLGAERRRIAVCGVNPHAGEHGLFGREDEDVLRPAVAALAQEGIAVTGPLPADTAFVRAVRGEFDAVGGGVPRPGPGAGEAPGLRARRQRDAGPAVRAHLRRPRHGLRHRRGRHRGPGQPAGRDGAGCGAHGVLAAAGPRPTDRTRHASPDAAPVALGRGLP